MIRTLLADWMSYVYLLAFVAAAVASFWPKRRAPVRRPRKMHRRAAA